MKKIYKNLQEGSQKVLNFEAKFFLTLIFFLVLPIIRLFLKKHTNKQQEKTAWKAWGMHSDVLEQVKKQ